MNSQLNSQREIDRVVSVAAFVDPIEARAASNFLNENGIHTRVVGDFTSNFQVEIASEIQVVVTLPQLERAQSLLKTFDARQSSVDWSKIDVGDPTPVRTDESEDLIPASKSGQHEDTTPPTQFNLQTLVAVQTILAICLAVVTAFSGLGLEPMFLIFPVVCCAILVGIVIATIGVANGNRRETAKKWIIASTLTYFGCGVIYMLASAFAWIMKTFMA